MKADRISDYKDKYGYLYEDDYDSIKGFNKNVFYSDELAGHIDLEPFFFSKASDSKMTQERGQQVTLMTIE